MTGKRPVRRQNRRKKEKKFTPRMQRKLLVIFACVLVLLIVVLLRIVYINIKSGNAYAKQVLSQKDYDSKILYSRRGEIQDKNGRLLAYSEKVYNIVLDCYEINKDEEQIEPTVEVLSEVFDDLERSELRERITSEQTRNSRYQVVLEEVTEEQKEAYEEYVSLSADRDLSKTERLRLQKVTGVWFEEDFKRKYPLSSLASTVIGFANKLGDGVTGVEAYYDSNLQGTNGRVFGYLNDNLEYQKKTIAPENGNTLQLTLDVNIQEIVEKYIAEFDEEYGDDPDDGTAKHGAKDIGVIIMDPDTGGILSMATNSGYDLNNPEGILTAWYPSSQIKGMQKEERSQKLYDIWSNYCISDAIEPGSTFKPITVAAALECGAITKNTGFICDGGEIVTDTEIHCDIYPGAHGEETLSDVLKNSCNDAMMQIGARMGVATFIKYQSLFNFGKTTGIDLPNESAGVVYTQKAMNEVELATCTFGQGLTCTMIQEIAAFTAVVNGGKYYQPHVVDKILTEDGKIVKDSSNLLLKQTISADVSETVREYLEAVVADGTGRTAQIPGYRVGGKTGTAEKIDPETGERAKGKYLVSFIGAVPINDPEIVMYVVVDEPNVEDQANSTFAQQLFRKIGMEILPYMNIYPTEDVDDALLAQLGLTQEDLGNEIVHTFQAYDSNHVLHQNARVENGRVVDADGTELEGAYIAEDGTVYDAYMNAVSTVEIKSNESKLDPKVENPNMALPPDENQEDASQTVTWDANATDDDYE